MRVLWIPFLFWGQVACHHRMKIISNPDGAKVYRNEDYVGTTPYEVSFWWFPFQKEELQLSLSGHHSLRLPLRYPFYRLSEDLVQFRFKRVFGIVPNEHRVILFQKKNAK